MFRYDALSECAVNEGALVAVYSQAIHDTVSELYGKALVLQTLVAPHAVWIALHGNQWQWINGK